MNKRLKLFELLKKESETLFTGSHNVFTPLALTNNVLSKINVENKTILVMYNVEFVITLIEVYNVNPEQITFYSDHTNKSKLVDRFGVKYIEELSNMKFDLVIGNPPYNDSSVGRNPIWQNFVLNHQGNECTSWIIPTSWMISETSTFNEVRKFILDSGLKKIKINAKDSFENAKVRTVTVVMEKDYKGLVEVQGKNNYFYDFRKHNILIDTGSEKGNDVLFFLKRLTPVLGFTTKNKKDVIISAETTNTKDTKFLKKMTKAGNEYGYAPAEKFSYNKHDNCWRVVVGYRPSGLEMGDYRLGLTSIVEPGVKILHSPLVYIPVDSKEHAENLQRYFKTKIVEEFILKNTRTSPTLDIKKSSGQTKFLPMLPKDVTITCEDDVYKFFNLNKEEINAVESSY